MDATLRETTKKALLLENLQIDFFTGGAMEVPNAESILSEINALIPQFETIILTLDWHPADHISFATSHPWRKIGQAFSVEDTVIELKPIHCVQNTFGANLYPQLQLTDTIHKIYKGTTRQSDDYSAFFNVDRTSTGLVEYLQKNGITNIYLAGMILEDNILATFKDALTLGFKVDILKQACLGKVSNQAVEGFWKYLNTLRNDP